MELHPLNGNMTSVAFLKKKFLLKIYFVLYATFPQYPYMQLSIIPSPLPLLVCVGISTHAFAYHFMMNK
jgi:hypothetical protein